MYVAVSLLIMFDERLVLLFGDPPLLFVGKLSELASSHGIWFLLTPGRCVYQ